MFISFPSKMNCYLICQLLSHMSISHMPSVQAFKKVKTNLYNVPFWSNPPMHSLHCDLTVLSFILIATAQRNGIMVWVSLTFLLPFHTFVEWLLAFRVSRLVWKYECVYFSQLSIMNIMFLASSDWHFSIPS